MFTAATLSDIQTIERGYLRVRIAYGGADVKPIVREYEFGGLALSDTMLVDTATAALDELNALRAFTDKLQVGTVLVDRGGG